MQAVVIRETAHRDTREARSPSSVRFWNSNSMIIENKQERERERERESGKTILKFDACIKASGSFEQFESNVKYCIALQLTGLVTRCSNQ